MHGWVRQERRAAVRRESRSQINLRGRRRLALPDFFARGPLLPSFERAASAEGRIFIRETDLSIRDLTRSVAMVISREVFPDKQTCKVR